MRYVIIFVLFLIIFFGVPHFIKKYYANKLTTCLLKRDYETFDKLVNSKLVQLFIMPFNIDYLKLNKALTIGDSKLINEAFKEFDNKKLSDIQKKSVYQNGFVYYVSQENKEQAKKYLTELLKLDNVEAELKESLKLTYDVEFEGSYARLDEVLERYNKASNLQEKMGYEATLIKMYTNKGDKEKAEYYTKLFKENLTEIENE